MDYGNFESRVSLNLGCLSSLVENVFGKCLENMAIVKSTQTQRQAIDSDNDKS